MSEFMKYRYEYLDPNPYSRPQRKLESVNGIVIHWVGNPMSTDYQNKQFFNNRKYGNDGYGSAHIIIDLDGSILEVIPLNEMAYHVGANSYVGGIQDKLNHIYPNAVTIGIEMTHPDWTGKPTDETYNATVLLVSRLCEQYGLNPNKDIYRHYDITGKECPRYFVNNPSEFIKFKKEVYDNMSNKMNDWQKKMAIDAINELDEAGIIQDPDMHIENLENDIMPQWLIWELFRRINNKIDNLKIV